MLRRIRNLIAPFSCGTIRAKKKHSKADKEEETNQEIELEKQQQSQLETQNDLKSQNDIKSENNQDVLDAESSSSGESLTTIINKYRGLKGRGYNNNMDTTISEMTNSSNIFNNEQQVRDNLNDDYVDITMRNNPNYPLTLDEQLGLPNKMGLDSAREILTPRIEKSQIIVLKNELKMAGGYGLVRLSKLYLISVKSNTNVNKFRVDKQYVCLKRCLNTPDYKKIIMYLNEIKIHKICNHENIVKYIGVVFLRPKKFYMVTEYCDGMDMFDFLSRKWSTTQYAEIAHIADGIANGLRYLHDNTIIHRDLKADNILLFPNRIHKEPELNGFVREWIPKITDFGLSWSSLHGFSEVNTNSNYVRGRCGTYEWAAPEVQNYSFAKGPLTYSSVTDIYGFGVMLAELLAGQTPLTHLDANQKRDLMRKRQLYYNECYVREDLCKSLVDLMWACTCYAPAYRPPMDIILHWMTIIKTEALFSYDPNFVPSTRMIFKRRNFTIPRI